MNPVDAVLAITYRCNARCVMCGIWKSRPGADLPPEVYRKLPATLRDVNLTGGEPFLRSDLPEVHAAVRAACPDAQTVISTNGILIDRILPAVRSMTRIEPNLGLAISLDGPPEVHDRLRGVSGAHDRAVGTVRALKAERVWNLRLAFTATAQNAGSLAYVYDLSQELGVEFTCAMEHTSEHYFHTQATGAPLPDEALRAQFEPAIRRELRSWSPKRWARAYFMQGMLDFAAGRGRPLPCRAGQDFFFMDPAGEIFTCNAAPFRIGNLTRESFDALWATPSADAARSRARTCRTECWMICSARTAITRAWPRVLHWAIRRKFARRA